MPKVRLALIGTSGFAKSYTQVANKAGVEFTWIHSRDIARAKSFAKDLKIPNFTDNLLKITEDKTISGAVICTEPSRHVDMAIPFLEAGKSVLIEKPLDTDWEKAASFYEKYKGSSQKVSVSSPKRFDPVLNRMKKLYEQQPSEKPTLAFVTLLWSRSEAYYKSGNGWRARESSVLLNQAIHWVDVCNWFFGEVESISIQSVTSNQSLLSLKYKNNTQVSLIASTALTKQYKDRFEIYYEDRKLSYQDFLERSKFKNKIFSRFQPSYLESQLKDFACSISESRQPATTLDAGMKAMRTVLGYTLSDTF